MTLTTKEGNRVTIESPDPLKTFQEVYPELKLKEDENNPN